MVVGKVPMKTLAGKNVIVTGASRGLGLHIAQKFWDNGANLLITSRSEHVLTGFKKKFAANALPGQEVHIAVADLKMPEAIDTIMNEARRVWKKLYGLINNAAILGPVGPVWENDWAAWQESIRVNMFAPVALCRACIPWMKVSGGGKIINLSGGGATSPRPYFTAYALAKIGMVRFTEILAEEVRGLNIQVNSMAPGALNTDMLREILEAGSKKAGQQEYAQALKQTENGGADLELAADLCLFLALSSSNDITGKLISAVWDHWENIPEHVQDLIDSDIYTLRRIVPKDRNKDWG
jgi:3-oxoacyl-[acyl-carrier protein] reductase